MVGESPGMYIAPPAFSNCYAIRPPDTWNTLVSPGKALSSMWTYLPAVGRCILGRCGQHNNTASPVFPRDSVYHSSSQCTFPYPFIIFLFMFLFLKAVRNHVSKAAPKDPIDTL